MSDDLAALKAKARLKHNNRGRCYPRRRCFECREVYPCLTIRLLDESEVAEGENKALTSVLAFVTDWTFDKAIEKFNELIALAEALNPSPENTALLYRYCGWLMAIRDQVAPFSDKLVTERKGWDAKFTMITELENSLAAADARAEGLERALGRYGTHKFTCAAKGWWDRFDSFHPSPDPCSCGFDAALAPADGEASL